MEYVANREKRTQVNEKSVFKYAYDRQYELPGGKYFEFAYSDDLNYSLSYFEEIYSQIKDDSLKAAMKAKAYRIIQYYGVHYYFGTGLLEIGIFSEEEIKILLDIDYYISIIKSKIDNNTSEYYPVNLGDAYTYIDFCFIPKDDEWSLDNIVKLLQAFEGAPYFIKLLVNTIEIAKKEQRQELYEKLLIYYKEQLPDYYKNYLAICKDPDYLLNKTNACLDEVELIGIDSRITIAPEVEAN